MIIARTSGQNPAPDLRVICRLCLEPDTGTIDIFTSQLSIPVRIMACAALEVQPSDGLPNLICEKCRYQLEVSYYFRKKCQYSDGKLRKHIRLLNAGRKSRIFLKSTNEDDDDIDEEVLQFEESIKFIKAEEEKTKAKENEANQKWLEEQKEAFRQEETRKIFEDFDNFMQTRRITTPNKPTENRPTDCVMEREKKTIHLPVKEEYREQNQEPHRQYPEAVCFPEQEVHNLDGDEDNEITSSEQIADVPEQDQDQDLMVCSDEGEDMGNPENQIIKTFLIFDKNNGEEEVREQSSHQMHDEEADMEDNLNHDDCEDADAPEEHDMQNKSNDEEDIDHFIFTADFDDSNNRDDEDESGRSSVVNSYQIEENGEIQYLKDERAETLSSLTDDELESHPIDRSVCDYVIEKVMPTNSLRYERKLPPKLKVQQRQPKSSSQVPPAGNDDTMLPSAFVSTDDLKIFKCSECPQSFTRSGSLLRHRSAHKGGREYCCEFCEKFFSCKSSLDRHIRIHTGEKPFTCDQCGKNFMQKEILTRHMTIHTGKRPYQCPHCPRSFVQKLLMKQHIDATHLEVPYILKHACHLCPKSFIHPSGLSRHLLTHKGSMFSCTKCTRAFNDRSSLRRHLAVLHKKSTPTTSKAIKN